jgi:FAD/FMN-containing dehydrogenase
MRNTQTGLSRRKLGRLFVFGSLVGARPASAAHFAKTPELDGTLHFDEATRAQYSTDYGNIIHEMPAAIAKPGSIRDLSRIVQFARDQRFRIAARGQGHLPFGQAQVQSGIVVDMRTLDGVDRIHGEEITVDAGCTWTAVVDSALEHGLTPPVLTDYLGLTVGGTLSIGGISPATWRYGAQVDNVKDLEVVTGRGDRVACSEHRNRELFQAVLAGQGQCAMLARATIRLVRAPEKVRSYLLAYADLLTLLRDLERMGGDGRFDGVLGYIVPSSQGWLYFMEGLKYFASSNRPDDRRLTGDLAHLRGTEQITEADYVQYVHRVQGPFGEALRPVLTQLIPISAAPGYIASALPRLAAGGGPADSPFVQLYAWKRRRFTRPMFRVAAESSILGFAVLQGASSPAILKEKIATNERLYKENRALGGTLYPFSTVRLSQHDWQMHYGPQWETLVKAKDRYDPDNLFASGPDTFHTRSDEA